MFFQEICFGKAKKGYKVYIMWKQDGLSIQEEHTFSCFVAIICAKRHTDSLLFYIPTPLSRKYG